MLHSRRFLEEYTFNLKSVKCSERRGVVEATFERLHITELERVN